MESIKHDQTSVVNSNNDYNDDNNDNDASPMIVMIVMIRTGNDWDIVEIMKN